LPDLKEVRRNCAYSHADSIESILAASGSSRSDDVSIAR
jgi:hypothetical protein